MASRQKMEKAGLGKADWKQAVDNCRYMEELDEICRFKPLSGKSRSFRVSELIGKDANSRAGEDIGDIKELVVDLAQAVVSYAVLAVGLSWTAGESFTHFRSLHSILGKARQI